MACRGKFSGSYIHYGIREHGMGSIMNGLTLHYLRPYGATFLVFSDYMRPPIRGSAMMHLPVVYIWTHDRFFGVLQHSTNVVALV